MSNIIGVLSNFIKVKGTINDSIYFTGRKKLCKVVREVKNPNTDQILIGKFSGVDSAVVLRQGVVMYFSLGHFYYKYYLCFPFLDRNF